MSNDIYYYPKRLKRLKSCKRVFNFAIGGRGCGKTYGFLLDQIKKNRKFILMRRMQSELDMLMGKHTAESMNPFKKINKDYGYNFKIQKVDSKYGIILSEDFDGGSPIHMGYAFSLTGVSNVRGFDASDIQDIVYDEFIPELHKNKIRNESDAFFNAYETINRNRELEGNEPVYVYCLSNANTIASQIFMDTGIIEKAEAMIKKNQDFLDMPKKNYTLELIPPGEFGELKKQTAISTFTSGTRFSEMAFSNTFAYDDFLNVKSMALREFIPLCSYSHIGIYKHKSLPIYYASMTINNDVVNFPDTDIGKAQFKVTYSRKLYQSILKNNMFFENYKIKYVLTELLV